MVNEFNKIIGDVLAAEGAVWLPDVGTLVVVRRAAERISSRRLRRSCNAVKFTGKEAGRSVVDVVAEVCGIDTEEARDIYDRWRAKSTADNVLAIDGVGHIDRQRFFVDESFDRLLNPNGHHVVELVKCRRNRALKRAAWGVAVIAALACAVWFTGLYERRGEIWSSLVGRFVAEPHTDSVVAAAEPVPEAEESVGGDDMPDVQAVAEDVTDEPVQEQPQQQAEQPSELSSVESVQPQPQQPQQLQSSPVDGIGRLTSGWSYVVYGVFSTPENALRAVGEVRARGVSGCSAFAYGAKYMVALYFSDSAADCNTYIRSAREYENIWVYTAH